jgi:hypothetical protein
VSRSCTISWPAALAATAIASEFCISANVLTWIGIPYVTEGGALPEKINPGTYLLCLAFAVQILRQDRPNRAAWLLLGGDRKLVLYLGCLVLCLCYMSLTTGTGNMIVLVDTFLPAGLLACILRDATAAELRVLLIVFRYGICINALLALGEATAHATLVPLYLNDVEYHPVDGEFRPTALYDHPLTGGVMTLMGLWQAPRTGLFRCLYLGLCSAALLAFGGRAAVAVALASAVFLAGSGLLRRVLRRDRRALHLLLCYGFSLVASTALAVVLIAAGFGERLLSHLYWDQSAQVRLAQWSFFEDLSFWQVLLGTRRADMLALLAPLWLRSGVGVLENFWLLMFVSLGFLGFPLFVIAFFTLLAWCWRRTGLHGHVLLVSVVIVVSTSNSLGRKSTLLVGLIAAIACLPEWRPAPGGRRIIQGPLSVPALPAAAAR